MNAIEEPKTIAAHLVQGTQIGTEISITGKWVPAKTGGIFRKSAESKEMLKEWEDIHQEARNHEGVLSTEINHAVGQDAVLVHHVFKNAEALLSYFDNTASTHAQALMAVAKPDIHLVRGTNIPQEVVDVLRARNIPVAFGEYLFGYVKNDYQQPDPERAVQVTAKWTCKSEGEIEDLIHWWQQVGTDAFDMEKGLVRYEVYRCVGENALIIHETFEDSDELKFHLTKGTAAKYKKEIDLTAAPENYFFRGPVSWTIRTYSKFMKLPATYSSRGSHFTIEGGSMSDGKTQVINNQLNTSKMETREIMVVYKWTANPGNSEQLKAIYANVERDMQETEPGALKVQCYFDESSSSLIVMDLFEDANALGQHLGTTAANHFPSLLEIATPGAFLFCGNVPEEMQQAARGMGLDATFAPNIFGFERAMSH